MRKIFFYNSIVSIFALAFLLVTTHSSHAQGVIRDAEIETLLMEYSHPIFVAGGLPPSSVNIFILNDTTLNAFVAGGRNIFLNTGLIFDTDTPEVLIGVIAHETGHIIGGHLARTQDALARSSKPVLFSTLLGLGALLAGAADLGMAVLAGGQTIGERSFLAYSRTQESAADQAALRLLKHSKISARGLEKLMEQLSHEEILSEEHRSPYTRTHPLSQERLNIFRQQIKRSRYYDKPTDKKLQHRHNMMKAKLYGFLSPISEVYREYRIEDKSKPARYARAISQYRIGNIDKALEMMTGLIEEEPKNPWFYELNGQILYESGQIDRSLPYYERALELVPDQALIMIELATAMLAMQKQEKIRPAINYLENALILEKENPRAYQQLAIAYYRLGDQPRADLATAERYFLLGDKRTARDIAKRAQKGMKRSSIQWLRAQDIITSGKDLEEESKREEQKTKGRRRSPRNR
ncbi:MAG: M48 family metalloprotease [Parvibaculales bacterium]